jgi:putative CocE/NonD family hydrolase
MEGMSLRASAAGFGGRFFWTLAFCLACVLWTVTRAKGQGVDAFDAKASYRKLEFMIPMRDGIRLYTAVYVPKGGEPVPFLLFRTPYGAGPSGPEEFADTLGLSDQSHSLEDEGFIFVRQDIRGKFRSEGDFVPMRPIVPQKSSTQTDESTDAYDTIEWLLRNIPGNNGRVGLWGISAPATQVLFGMIGPHPAIRAASPQAPAVDMFIGDDFHHNGALRLSYTFFWLSRVAGIRSGPSDADTRPLSLDTPDQYRFYLQMGPIRNANARYLHDQVPQWNEYMRHGTYDDFWSSRNMLHYLRNVSFPVLTVASWFDAEDFYGPMRVYQQLKEGSPDGRRVRTRGME